MASKQITPFQLTDQFTMDNFNQRINETNIALQSVSNPNLLDNWYFGNPVDQRGGYVVPPGTTYYNLGNLAISIGELPSYATVVRYATYDDVTYPVVKVDGTEYMTRNGTAVRGYTGSGYGIDRWYLNISSSTAGGIQILDDCIQFIANGGTHIIEQKIEWLEDISGKTVTLSVLIDTFGLVSVTTALGSIKYKYFNGSNSADGYMSVEQKSSGIVSIVIGSNGTARKVYAAKLELGTQQTLAHQDANGNWVLNEIPDYGEQLARCQRYHFEFGPSHALIAYDGYGVNSPVVYFPVQMRTVPTIKVYSKAGTENAISYWNGSADVDFTDFYLDWNENFVVLRSNGKFTPGGIYTIGKLIAYADL